MSALLAPASLQAMPPKKGRAKAEPKKKGEAATNAGLSQQGVATAATARRRWKAKGQDPDTEQAPVAETSQDEVETCSIRAQESSLATKKRFALFCFLSSSFPFLLFIFLVFVSLLFFMFS